MTAAPSHQLEIERLCGGYVLVPHCTCGWIGVGGTEKCTAEDAFEAHCAELWRDAQQVEVSNESQGPAPVLRRDADPQMKGDTSHDH